MVKCASRGRLPAALSVFFQDAKCLRTVTKQGAGFSALGILFAT